MPKPPDRPVIYHITHVDNLPDIIGNGGLISDAAMIARGGPKAGIGMSNIKQRRLTLPVDCHPGDHVGDYVPFYFCPRSIMLYVIRCGNNAELAYYGGQGPIVHLVADLREVVAWADDEGRRWAFSLSNAGAYYTEFRATLNELDDINWRAVQATDFRSSDIKEGKQAEFLVYDAFPWSLIRGIGVRSTKIKLQVDATLAAGDHQPVVKVLPSWYF